MIKYFGEGEEIIVRVSKIINKKEEVLLKDISIIFFIASIVVSPYITVGISIILTIILASYKVKNLN